MTATAVFPEISVLLGPCDDMRAEAFVRLVGSGTSAARITGTIIGPRRGRDTTLPTTSRLVPLPGGADVGPVSRAILTEPAYWTPELPNLYRLEATVDSPSTGPSDSAAGRTDTLIGLRRLGVRGRSLWLDGRRWAPRAVVAAGRPDLPAVKAASLGAVLVNVLEEDLASADEMGVALIPLLGAADLMTAKVAALARHPAAMLALVAADVPSEVIAGRLATLRRTKGTMLIGQAVDGSQPPSMVKTPLDFIVTKYTS